MDVSKSGYYDYIKRKNRGFLSDPFEMQLKDEIQNIVLMFPRYGYRRVTKELHRRGYEVNHKRVLRLMRDDNLLCLRKRKFVGTTDSNHSFTVYPNLAKDMVVTDINQLWVCDITYIQLLSEFVYLAVILDVFSRKCIGWELDRFLDTRLTLNSLHKALDARWTPELKGLVHHSDQGVQYASYDYIDCLRKHHIQISMCRKGNPFDNAFAESFIKTLKWEEVYLFEYETYNEAYRRINNFIGDVYNEKRIHSSIGYLTPNEFEMGLILQTHA